MGWVDRRGAAGWLACRAAAGQRTVCLPLPFPCPPLTYLLQHIQALHDLQALRQACSEPRQRDWWLAPEVQATGHRHLDAAQPTLQSHMLPSKSAGTHLANHHVLAVALLCCAKGDVELRRVTVLAWGRRSDGSGKRVRVACGWQGNSRAN